MTEKERDDLAARLRRLEARLHSYLMQDHWSDADFAAQRELKDEIDIVRSAIKADGAPPN